MEGKTMTLRILFLFFVFVFTACEPSSTEVERANILVSIRDGDNKRIDPGPIIDVGGRIEIHPGQESVIKGSRTYFGFFESAIDCFADFVDGEVGEVACYLFDENSENGFVEISASIVIDKDPTYEPGKSYILTCAAFLEDDEPVHPTCSASLLPKP
jgi:hypothetical protein